MVSGQYKAIMPFNNLKRLEFWLGVTNASQKDGQTLRDRATQLQRVPKAHQVLARAGTLKFNNLYVAKDKENVIIRG